MMLTHYIILLHQLTPSSPKFLPLVGCCIITLMIVMSSSAPLPATPTNIDVVVVVIAAARQVVAGSLLRGLRDND